MKSLKSYIQERLIIRKNKCNYFPKSKEELKDIILERIKAEGKEVDLNDIDVSNITDMSYMFYNCSKFNQDISKWDVSNIINKDKMFDDCPIKEKYKPKFK